MKAFNKYEKNENGSFDIPIGETFNYKGVALKVVRDNGNCCYACYFIPDERYVCGRFACERSVRKDKKDIVFEKVEE